MGGRWMDLSGVRGGARTRHLSPLHAQKHSCSLASSSFLRLIGGSALLSGAGAAGDSFVAWSPYGGLNKDKNQPFRLAIDEQEQGQSSPSASRAKSAADGITVTDEESLKQKTNIWSDLEAAMKQIEEDHRNPYEESITSRAVPADKLSRDKARWRSLAGSPILVVFTKPGKESEEALREAQIAQGIVLDFGGTTAVANLEANKEPEIAKSLGITSFPLLRMYRDGNVEGTNYATYNGTDMTAAEIAHWVLRNENFGVQFVAKEWRPAREGASLASPAGPVVYASVFKGSLNEQLLESIIAAKNSLPSPFTLFKVRYVADLSNESFRVYRQQLPFNTGEEDSLSLNDTTWELDAVLRLLLEAEDRKIFFGEAPSSALVGTRQLFSVFVSEHENLQDIALLLLEFQRKYKDRIAFHIASRTLQKAARSESIFSHSWGGAVLRGSQPDPAAYQRAAGVFREEVPFSQYTLSMPFNYHNMKAFFQEWESGKRELHFRSHRETFTEKDSPVLELNHGEFVRLLRKQRRAPLAVLYYKSDCEDCVDFLKSWKAIAKIFAEEAELKGSIIFGQINASLNDLVDFDMRARIPAVAMYPHGEAALDRRMLYVGPPIVELMGNFVHAFRANHGEL
ncbi:hypothetical protein Efla_006967 [Eimeria flavescens]